MHVIYIYKKHRQRQQQQKEKKTHKETRRISILMMQKSGPPSISGVYLDFEET